MTTLLKNCYALIKTNNHYEAIPNTHILIMDNTITYIGKDIQKADQVIDMTNKLVMPGLVNAHGHSPMTLLRGYGSGLSLTHWLNDCIFPAEAKLTPEAVYVGAKLAALEMISGGTTLYSEMYDFPYAEMKAVAESGMKVNICRTGLAFDKEETMDKSIRFLECNDVVKVGKGLLDTNEEIKRELHCEKLPNSIKNAIKSGLIVGEYSYHSEYLTSENFVKGTANVRQQIPSGIQLHVSETINEVNECKLRHNDMTPMEYFEACGALEVGPIYAAHCVHVTDHDLDIMKKHNVSLVHNPTSNLKLGSGIAPIVKAINKGVNVCLGTDGCASNNNLDMFEEMHLAALLPCGVAEDPTVMQVDAVLDMATINGAKAMGRNDTGKLEVGYKADIIAIDLDKPHLFPRKDIPSLIVYSMQASDVTFTMVNGKILYKDGKFFTLNKKEILNEADSIISSLNL